MKASYLGLIVLAVTGCGDNGVAQVDSFISNLAAQQCAWEFRCCKDPEIKQLDGHKFTTMDDCVPYRTLVLEDQLFLDRLAAKEGRLRVDSPKAQACIDQMMNTACNPKPGTVLPTPMNPMEMDACINVLRGSTAIGNECIYTDECIEGARCVGDKSAVGRGVCVPYQEVDQICNDDADCDPKVKQLYCAKQDFKCHLRSKLGEKCAYTTDDTGKNPMLPLLLECDNQLGNVYCDPSTATCKQLPSDGEPCLSPPPPGVISSCDPDPKLMLVCDTSGGTPPLTSGVCRAPGKLGDDCTTIQCGKDLYCDTSTGTSRTCKAVPGFGGDCQMSQGRCKEPFFCNFNKQPSSCDQPSSVGQSCASPNPPCDTLANLFCDPQTQICKTKLPDGQLCTSSIECLSSDCSVTVGGGAMTLCQPHVIVQTIECTGR